MDCPKCKAAMELVTVANVEVDRCTNCKGLWFDAGEIDRLKKAKAAKQFQENMQKGDKIVTIAGIHGTVNKVNEDGTLMLETSPGSYMKIEKSAISIDWTNNLKKAAAVTDKK